MSHLKQLILIGLPVIVLCSCRAVTEERPLVASPVQLREQAVAMRVRASGLRADAADLEKVIGGSLEEKKRLERRLDAIESQIGERAPRLSELREELGQLPPYEAYTKARTVERWENTLSTLQSRRDVTLERIRSLSRRIDEHERMRETHEIRAGELDHRAGELDRHAARLEEMGPAAERDFWSEW